MSRRRKFWRTVRYAVLSAALLAAGFIEILNLTTLREVVDN